MVDVIGWLYRTIYGTYDGLTCCRGCRNRLHKILVETLDDVDMVVIMIKYDHTKQNWEKRRVKSCTIASISVHWMEFIISS